MMRPVGRMIVIGSRGSPLALWQANHVQELLRALGAETRIEVIRTSGDRIQDAPLAGAGGKGLFTKEIDQALLSGQIDVAVHSMKDVPVELPAGLVIAAIPPREEARDAMVGRRLDQLVEGAVIGTSSLRRSAQLILFGRLEIRMLRGNVETRLRKLDEGRYDAIVLAAAGLRRLNLESRIAGLLPVEIMCPAVGQGALAVETRDDGGPALQLAARLDDAPARAAVTAERAFLKALGGGCQVPVGGYARVTDAGVHLRAIVASPDGARAVRGELAGADPEATGVELGRRLLEQGARTILEAVYAA